MNVAHLKLIFHNSLYAGRSKSMTLASPEVTVSWGKQRGGERGNHGTLRQCALEGRNIQFPECELPFLRDSSNPSRG